MSVSSRSSSPPTLLSMSLSSTNTSRSSSPYPDDDLANKVHEQMQELPHEVGPGNWALQPMPHPAQGSPRRYHQPSGGVAPNIGFALAPQNVPYTHNGTGMCYPQQAAHSNRGPRPYQFPHQQNQFTPPSAWNRPDSFQPGSFGCLPQQRWVPNKPRGGKPKRGGRQQKPAHARHRKPNKAHSNKVWHRGNKRLNPSRGTAPGESEPSEART